MSGPFRWLFRAAGELRQTQAGARHEASDTIADHVIDGLEDALVVVDLDLRIVRWNSAMEALTAVDRSRAIGGAVADIVAKVGTLDVPHHLRLAVAGETTHLTETVRDTNEPPRWRTVRCQPLRDPDGRITGAAAFVRDATERRRRAVLVHAMETIGRSLTSSLALPDVLDTITRRTLEVMAADAALVVSWDGQAPLFRVMRTAGRLSGEYAAAGTIPVGGGPIARAILESRVVTTSNMLADPAFWLLPERRAEVEREGYKSVAAAPLVSKGRVHGALVVHYWSERAFTDEERNALELLAEHAALAIDSAQLYGQALRRAARLQDLVAVSQSITASLDTQDVMQRIVQAAAAMTPGALASVHIHHAERDVLEFAATSGPELERFPRVHPASVGLPALVVERRLPVLIAEPVTHPRTLVPDWWRERPSATYCGVPIVVGETFVGVLDYILPAGLPDREEQEILQLLADQAGVAIRNAGLYQAERAQTERTRTLAAINQRISGALDLDELLRMISASAAQLTGTRFVAFWLADEATRTLSFRGGSVPELAKDFPVATRSYDIGAVGWVARHRTPVEIPDVFADDRVDPREWWRRWGLRSFSAYPVIAGGELLAVLSLSHSEPIEFSREIREVLDLFIAQAGVAIQNARLYRAAEQRRDVAEALARLGRGLTGTLDHAHIARLVAQGVVELLGSRNAAVYRLAPDAGTLHTLAWSGVDAELFEGVVLAPGEGVAGRAVVERRLVSSADILRDPDVRLSESLRTRLTRFGHRVLVGAPLIARDQVIGALVLSDDDRQFSGEELQALQAFADQAALALDNARLYAAARDSFERLRETQAQLVQAGKLSALGQLVSGVAHELNNPLSVIIGYGQLLAKRQIADNVRRPLDMIASQADRMARIVHNLLYFARQRPPAHAPVDLHQVIEQTLALRLNQLTLSGIVVERDFASDLPLITGDLHQLQQVFLNLLLNAEQAIVPASETGGHIVFRTRVAENGLAVLSSVIDDGPGIPEDALPRVFEPFFTTKDVGAGTGLGLSVSYGIAEEHHGRLTVESRPGRTIFTLELPVGQLPATARAAVAPALALVLGAGRLALLVEDEPAVRELVVTLLEDTGWRVDTAVGGRAALTMVKRTRYELIVSDVRMPDGSGRDFYRGAVDHDATLAERFVFITGDTANPMALEFLKGTATLVLEKPFSTDVFLDAVRRTASRQSDLPRSS